MTVYTIGQSTKPVGYCKLHKNTLSARQLRKRECSSKNCRHLVKYEGHSYWVQKKSIRIKKKLAKQKEQEKIKKLLNERAKKIK